MKKHVINILKDAIKNRDGSAATLDRYAEMILKYIPEPPQVELPAPPPPPPLREVIEGVSCSAEKKKKFRF